jgi:hypothetical protein
MINDYGMWISDFGIHNSVIINVFCNDKIRNPQSKIRNPKSFINTDIKVLPLRLYFC